MILHEPYYTAVVIAFGIVFFGGLAALAPHSRPRPRNRTRPKLIGRGWWR